jgi:hypothetical protein
MSTHGRRQVPILERDLVEKLLPGLRAGRYHLVLGAGASLDCSNESGQLLSARGLAAELVAGLSDAPVDVSLPRAYETMLATSGPEATHDFLRRRFSGCECQEWHRSLTRIPWECIWTLNIDDAMEGAYASSPDRSQDVQTVLPMDDLRHLGGAQRTTCLVHLHGYVGSIQARSNPELTFSLQEYLASVRAADAATWHSTFRYMFSTAPLLILGATMNEELDFLEVVRRGNSSAKYGYPSAIVRPDISSFEWAEYERWGLTPVSATAEEFVSALRANLEAADPQPTDSYNNRYTARTFVPPEDVVQIPAKNHDFYGGDHPQIDDIQSGLDAIPSWLEQLADDIGQPYGSTPSTRLYLLHGSAYSGKSTAIIRLAVELEARGWSPYFLGGQERLDPDELLRFFADRPNALLVLDEVRWEADDLRASFQLFKEKHSRLIVIGSERSSRLELVRKSIGERYIVGLHSRLFVEPTSQLWTAILDVRSAHARLGRLERLPDRARKLHFSEHGHNLYSSLASLEDAKGFLSRPIAEIERLGAGEREVLALLGLAAYQGLPFPVGLASAVTSLSLWDVEVAIDEGALQDWVRRGLPEPGIITLRHRFLGDRIAEGEIDLMLERSLGELLADACVVLAPQVNVDAIRSRTLSFRLARAFMNAEFVERLVGRDAVDSWYERLREPYDWHARYWEQRALAMRSDLDRAHSFASRAVNRHRDAFSLNTLGTILMRRAISPGESESGAMSYWREATSALRESRQVGSGRFEHPYVTCFVYTQRLLRRVREAGNLDEIEEELYDWEDDRLARSEVDREELDSASERVFRSLDEARGS